MLRSLAVLELWNNGGPGLDSGRFSEQVKGHGDGNLANLLRKDQKPDLNIVVRRVLAGAPSFAETAARMLQPQRFLEVSAANDLTCRYTWAEQRT